MRGTPARQDEQRWTPSLVAIGALLAVALVVALILFVGVSRGDDSPDFSDDTVVPSDDADAPPAEAAEAADDVPDVRDDAVAAASGPPRIATVQAFDPDGDNRSENDAQAGLALADGSASTAWATECYQDRYLGAKRGVGLILGLSSMSSGSLSVDTLNAPYQLELYGATSAGPPADLAGWTPIDDTRFADEPGTVEFDVEEPVTHLLVWLKELGPDEACSQANPYRGRLGEISFVP